MQREDWMTVPMARSRPAPEADAGNGEDAEEHGKAPDEKPADNDPDKPKVSVRLRVIEPSCQGLAGVLCQLAVVGCQSNKWTRQPLGLPVRFTQA